MMLDNPKKSCRANRPTAKTRKHTNAASREKHRLKDSRASQKKVRADDELLVRGEASFAVKLRFSDELGIL